MPLVVLCLFDKNKTKIVEPDCYVESFIKYGEYQKQGNSCLYMASMVASVPNNFFSQEI